MGMPEKVRMGKNAACFTHSAKKIDNARIGHGLSNFSAPQIDKNEVRVSLTELLKEIARVEGHERWRDGNTVGLPCFGSRSIAIVVPRHNANDIVPGANIFMTKSKCLPYADSRLVQ